MATLKQYFDTDFNRILSAHQPFLFESESENIEVICRVHYDFDANVTFVSYYIPTLINLVPLCVNLVEDLNWAEKMIQDLPVQSGRLGDESIISTDMQFSVRIHLYSDAEFSIQDFEILKER